MSDQTKTPTEHSCTCTAYSIEAMLTTDLPKQICGNVLDAKWRTLSIESASMGVPRCMDYHADIFAKLGVMGYEAAQAVRWWFHAEAARTLEHYGLRTRLVRHAVSYTMKAVPGESMEEAGGQHA